MLYGIVEADLYWRRLVGGGKGACELIPRVLERRGRVGIYIIVACSLEGAVLLIRRVYE